MSWDVTQPFWVKAKQWFPVWIWIGLPGEWTYTTIQARPIGSTDQWFKPLFVMDQGVRAVGVTSAGKPKWEYGADVYNPNDVSVQFTLHGV
ncbi:hypothetical protein GCM10009544_18310 [Streptomyces stramineus]|uniref:DUF5060 domain-containing protein n=1 Tax=Streptomyces stramineus TaxID=173861 RepID=A0ABP3JMF2_9ACTN